MGSRRTLVFALAVVPLAVVALAGCGEDREGSVEQSGGSTATTGTTTAPAPTGAAVATVKVKETEYELDPSNPRIAKVGAVSFEVENAGEITHALEVEGPGGEVETEGIEPGASATLKVDLSKPGTYEWYCPIGDHEDRGMKGKITVAGGGSGASKEHSGKRDDDSGNRGDDSGHRGDDSGQRGDDSGKGGEDSGKRSGSRGGGSGVY